MKIIRFTMNSPSSSKNLSLQNRAKIVAKIGTYYTVTVIPGPIQPE